MEVKFPQPLPVAHLAEILKGEVEGDGALLVTGAAHPALAREGHLTFVMSPEAAGLAAASGASAAVASPGVAIPGKTVIRVKNPRYALAIGLRAIQPSRRLPPGIHPSAVVAEDAEMGAEVAVGPLAVVSEGCRIGEGSCIGAGSILERDVVLGEGCTIHSHVTLRYGIRIGSRVEIHSGTVIGSDGFGYVQEGATSTDDRTYRRYFQKKEPHIKIPQVGSVIIEDDVEIGANVTVDRGTMGNTRIGKGVKIDNHVQVAHNVDIGEHAIVISQAGISGSARIGKHATLGGQAGISEGARVGDGAIVGAKSGVTPGKRVPPGTAWAGWIGKPAEEYLRGLASMALLPKALKRIRALEKEIARMKEARG